MFFGLASKKRMVESLNLSKTLANFRKWGICIKFGVFKVVHTSDRVRSTQV